MSTSSLLDPHVEKAAIRHELEEDFRFLTAFHKEQIVPVLQSRVDGARNLISLSAGTVIASVSVAQFVREEVGTRAAAWLLPTSWVLFTVTILLCLYRTTFLNQGLGFGWVLYSHRGEILDELEQTVTPEIAAQQVRQKRNDAVVKADGLVIRAMTWDRKLAPAAGCSFLMAILALVLFAVINLTP